MSPSMNTIAEYLRNAGYRTGAVISNYVLHRHKSYENGFDTYDDRMDDRELVRRSPERIGEKTTAAAVAWLRRNGDRPFFLWVHYQDPHGPYTPPERYRSLFVEESAPSTDLRVSDGVSGQGGIPSYQALDGDRASSHYVGQYDAEIRYLDDSLRDLVQEIKRMGLWEGALVIFSADHGEGMGEHDYYFAHGEHLYPGQLHVPLILWGPPERVAPGRDETVVQLADIAPTILSFAGISPVSDSPGRDLLGGGLEDAEVLSETYTTDNYKCSLLTRDLQVVYDRLNDDYRPYDWREGVFLAPADLPDRKRYDQLVRTLTTLCNPDVLPSEGALPPGEAEKLKSLGYVH
jgi:arylsulfatase A-like enzyme